MNENPKRDTVSAGLSREAKWIIGVVISAATIGIAIAGILSAQISMQIDGVNARIDDLREDTTRQIDQSREDTTRQIDQSHEDTTRQIDQLREEVRRMDDRLRALEIAIGRLDPNFPPAPDGDGHRPDLPVDATVRPDGRPEVGTAVVSGLAEH